VVAGKLIAAALASAFALVAHAADVKLPQSREDFRKLDVAAPGESTRRGVVQRVTPVKTTSKAASPMDSQANRATADIMSDRPLVATPQVGKGNKEATTVDTTKTEYQVVVRWEDGTIGVVREDHDPGMKQGDAVAVINGKLVRQAH